MKTYLLTYAKTELLWMYTERHEVPYWSTYSKTRMLLYSITVSKYFDLAIAGVIGLNVITMALEFYLMPKVCLSVD